MGEPGGRLLASRLGLMKTQPASALAGVPASLLHRLPGMAIHAVHRDLALCPARAEPLSRVTSELSQRRHTVLASRFTGN